MMNLQQGFGGLHRNTQFLAQLACQRPRYRFARFYLTAGEFPQPALMRMVGSAGEQDGPGGIGEDSHRDLDDSRRGGHVRYSALIRT